MMGAMAEGVVRNVVFDIGGVLLDWNPRHLYRDLVADPAELEWFLANVCTMVWNAELDAGRPFDEACDALASAHPDHADLVHAWKQIGRAPSELQSLMRTSYAVFCLQKTQHK